MENRQLYIFTAAQVAALGAVLWLVFFNSASWDWQRSMGVVLVVAGVSGIATARFQLGKSFSLKPEAHQLVTRGVYSKIRNPIYVFGIVMVAGLILAVHRPVWWLVLAAVAVLQTLRARREARVLEVAFGDEYREYRRKTWF
jgi:protein-S-isoprenylcysteine O-methyltransferase Ste14